MKFVGDLIIDVKGKRENWPFKIYCINNEINHIKNLFWYKKIKSFIFKMFNYFFAKNVRKYIY